MSGPDLLFDIANDLLVISEAILVEAGQPELDRKFVNTGPEVLAPVEYGPAENQLTVTVGPLSPDLFSDLVQRRQGMAASGMLWKAAYTITLLRPFPMHSDASTGSPLPSPEQLQKAAGTQLADGWQLARGLSWHWMHKNLVPSFQFDHENMQWQSPSWTQLNPQGGIAGWQGRFSISIHDQYAPSAETLAAIADLA